MNTIDLYFASVNDLPREKIIEWPGESSTIIPRAERHLVTICDNWPRRGSQFRKPSPGHSSW